MEQIPKNRVECVVCGHDWYKRTEKPLQCPKCTARNWWDKSKHVINRKDKELKQESETKMEQPKNKNIKFSEEVI